MSRLHRNNAAEWAMWAALLPIACVIWTWRSVTKRKPKASASSKQQPPQRRGVVIESLHSRTMN